jgi:glycosyltransferase involved in cell wall biosynthesis
MLSVIVTTYNQPEFLHAVLAGYLAQRDADFEVIVADDGSTAETTQLVDAFRTQADFSLKHVWHEDSGFRAGAIRNRAIAAASGEYIVFTDGDCIPRSNFVTGHRSLAEHGCFLAGNRILLSQDFTRRIVAEQIPVHAWSALRLSKARGQGDVNRLLPLLRLPLGHRLRTRGGQRWAGARTCNLSAWRDDLLTVNGFDEAYSGWGLEDSDLALRLIHSGVQKKSGQFALPVLHLWHPENARDDLERNRQMLEELMQSRRVRAVCGVDRYLNESDAGQFAA